MTEEEMSYFKNKMNASKQKNQTDFLLAVLRKRKIIVIEELKPLLVELKRQGNNLNQISRNLNEGAGFGDPARKVLNECWKAYRAILSFSEIK